MPQPIEIDISIDIDAPPEVVWPYLVDWERLGEWMAEASQFKVTSGHRSGVGVEAEARIRIGGLVSIDKVRVTRWEPPTLLEITHLGWVKGTGVMRAGATGAGTHLEWKESFIPPWGIFGWIGMKIWTPLIRRTFVGDLHLLKALVESRPGQRE